MLSEQQIVEAINPKRTFLLKRPRARDIIAMVAEESDVSVNLILSKLQFWWIVRPRQVAYLLCREHTGKAFAALGREFNRDPTTLISGVRRIRVVMEGNQEMAQLYATVKAKLK